MRSIQGSSKVFGLAPVTKGIAKSHPDILAIGHSAILGVPGVIFADKKEQIAVSRNGRTQFRQVGIDTRTQVLDLYNRIFFDNIFFLGNEFGGSINCGLSDNAVIYDEQQKKKVAVLQGLDICFYNVKP
jgi:hypothetical protein